MKEVSKIVAYFVAVILLGALIAPLLFWLLHGIEPWALTNDLLRWQPDENGDIQFQGLLSPIMAADFQKVFHRAILLSAVILLWPAWRWIGGKSIRNFGLAPDLRWRSHLIRGFVIGAGLVGIMAAVYVFFGVYHFKPRLPWEALPQIALSAVVVACLEEAVFRGAIMGLFLRALKPIPALAWTTGIFAILHFLRPGVGVDSSKVTWLSGFELLPQLFGSFANPTLLIAGFATLFTLGWLLGYARLRTGSLWMSIGIHAGIVLLKMGFARFTKRDQLHLPWIGTELQIGVVPIAVLLVGLFLVWRRLEYEDLLPNRQRAA